MILQRGSLRTTLRFRLAILKAARNFLTRLASVKLHSKQRGLTKKEERLGWITRGHEPQAASDKPQATSDKLPHNKQKKEYRLKS
jgi:hypothetical protein